MTLSELLRFFLEAAITSLMGLFTAYLVFGVRLRRPAHLALAGLCGAFAATSAINMLAGTGILLWLRPINLALELMISPSIFLFVVQTRQDPPTLRLRDVFHLLPAIMALAIWRFHLPIPLNEFIVLVHTLYLGLIGWSWWQQKSAYPSIALRQSLFGLAGFMAVFVVLRVTIGLETALGGQFFRDGLGYVLMLTAVLVLACGIILTVLRRPDMLEISSAFTRYAGSDLADGEAEMILDRLDRLMSKEQVFHDPDLDLDGLAGLIGAPPRHVSQAVNAHFRTSVPLYVNRLRVNEVADRLVGPGGASANITALMLEAGFGSKSAFHREFKRVHDMTPSAYRRQMAARSVEVGLE
jgi:AraC-like DNA-binding protein